MDWWFFLIPTLARSQVSVIIENAVVSTVIHSVADYSRKTVRTFYLSKLRKLAQMQS